jgi:hypothetical protein
VRGAKRSNKKARQLGHVLGCEPVPVNALVSVADGAPGFGTAVIGGLPQGNLLLFGAVAYLQFTNVGANITATFTGSFSIGTEPTADNDLVDANEANVVQSTTLTAATAGVSPNTRGTTAAAGFAGPVLLDNTDGTLELNLNVLIDDAAISGAGSLRARGTVFLAVLPLGDD